MIKNNHKIYQTASVILLAIIIYGLLNVCLTTIKVQAATAVSPVALSAGGFQSCARHVRISEENIARPSLPLPECCVSQNRNFAAVVVTPGDKITGGYSLPAVMTASALIPEDNFTFYTSLPASSPPTALALASTVKRE